MGSAKSFEKQLLPTHLLEKSLFLQNLSNRNFDPKIKYPKTSYVNDLQFVFRTSKHPKTSYVNDLQYETRNTLQTLQICKKKRQFVLI